MDYSVHWKSSIGDMVTTFQNPEDAALFQKAIASVSIENPKIKLVNDYRLPTQREKELIKRAVELYGPESQFGMLVEECAEVIQAISKRNRGYNSNIAEEIADVLIVIDSVVDVLDISNQVQQIREYKINRLEMKLKEEE